MLVKPIASRQPGGEDNWDVLVLGAGAAGLMAGIAAATAGRRVLVLEKNRRPGVKILMSGGTRCNITHATDNRGIVEAFGSSGRFLHSPLAALSVEDTIQFFQDAGVATKIEATGKVFPVSDKARDVLAALLRRLEESGARLALEEPVNSVERRGDQFEAITSKRKLVASRVILTTGGRSYPGSGTTGDGYRIATGFGHAIVPPCPALVPIRVDHPGLAALQGLTLPDVAVRILEGGRVLGQRRGSLLFAHFGLSGPVILDLSRLITLHPQPRSLRLVLDFLPGFDEVEFDRLLRQQALESGKKQLAGVLSAHLPRRLAEVVVGTAGLGIDRLASGLARGDRQRLVELTKRFAIPVLGTLGFEKAEVTAGGVALSEVDSRTMESKLAAGFFLAGEVLDLDGPIGGYNFQSAFSTGWLAGLSCGEKGSG